jgi:hypothetical protein
LRPEYEKRLQARREAAARHTKAFETIGNWRLVVVVSGAVLTWLNFWLLPLPAAVFVGLIIYHERVVRSLDGEKRAVAFYERGIARLEDRWAGSGESGERFRDPAHAYAEDLDLFGKGSLFQLLSAARTGAGEAMLADWLMAPTDASTAAQRQAAIDDLRPRLDLREDLALLGEDIRAEVHSDALEQWGAAPPVPLPPGGRIVALLFAVTTAILVTGYFLQVWPFFVVALFVLIQSVFAIWLRPRVNHILGAVNAPARDLRLLGQLLERLEREPFAAPRLLALRAELETNGMPPSRQIRQLHKLIERNDASRNQGFAIFARLLLWSTQCAMAIEAWRQKSGPLIGRWLAAVAEIEALSSLAGYAAEHPDDPFPEFSADAPLFDGEGIAHPLLPVQTGVRNDLRLDADMRLLLVSGSNMSGKSTMLRAVGLNTVLAWAGAPVRARRLQVSPLVIGASMRVQDSLQDGKSRFYAEITRLRQVVDLGSGTTPLLFLLDELLSGTNSHDRRIGAEAIVTSLVQRGNIGLVTTHDLALSNVAETLAPHAMNVHFEDHLEGGRIAFDYRMRPGVVRKSNALELMRSIGLDV